MSLRSFFLIAYIGILIAQVALLQRTAFGDSPLTTLFSMCVYLSYGFLYLVPALFVTWLAQILSKQFTQSTLLTTLTAIVTSATTIILVYADAFIYKLYGFHINGFIINLVTTPGGIESMGGSTSSEMTFGLRVTAITGSLALAAYVLTHWSGTAAKMNNVHRGRLRWVLAGLLVITGSERIIYAHADATANSAILASAAAFPGYQPLLCRQCAQYAGVTVVRQRQFDGGHDRSISLNYPLAPIAFTKPDQPYNIVWLVAESWRWDMLDPEITPNAWAFSEQASRFNRHFSGGNGTRMGMFSMFYGLHGQYWFSMLDDARPPVIMDVLDRQGYQWQMFSSAKFSYPEFDKTVFANVGDANLHDDNEGPSWRDDRHNVDKLLAFMDQRDADKPFMTFMFFESTHARYYFPKESTIREDYLQDFNYATMDIESPHNMQLIKNRYINSAHHLDQQFGRILDHLETTGALDNTIVIMTGDHGEEFMEKGRWGHNSEFTNEQIRVPLVLWIPGRAAQQIDNLTSHVDIVPTIAPLLGITSAVPTYALGQSLFDSSDRDYIVATDWSSIAIVDHEYKVRIPMMMSRMRRNQLSTSDDQIIEDTDEYFNTRQQNLLDIMEELARFREKG